MLNCAVLNFAMLNYANIDYAVLNFAMLNYANIDCAVLNFAMLNYAKVLLVSANKNASLRDARKSLSLALKCALTFPSVTEGQEKPPTLT